MSIILIIDISRRLIVKRSSLVFLISFLVWTLTPSLNHFLRVGLYFTKHLAVKVVFDLYTYLNRYLISKNENIITVYNDFDLLAFPCRHQTDKTQVWHTRGSWLIIEGFFAQFTEDDERSAGKCNSYNSHSLGCLKLVIPYNIA